MGTLNWVSDKPTFGHWLQPVFFVAGHGLYAFTQGRMTRIAGCILALGAPFFMSQIESPLNAVSYVLGAGVLGGAFMGQFLGHWYLNVPGMNIRELKKVTAIFLGALILKSIENVVYLSFFNTTPSETFSWIDEMGRPLALDPSALQTGVQYNIETAILGLRGDTAFGLGLYGLLIYSMRVLWGLIAPLILAVLIQKTVEMRSTQSATGILYSSCVLVLLGEGAAIFLLLNLGWRV